MIKWDAGHGLAGTAFSEWEEPHTVTALQHRVRRCLGYGKRDMLGTRRIVLAKKM